MTLYVAILAFFAVPSRLAFQIPDTGSAVANLWSKFDLQLQDAVIQALDRHDRHRRASPSLQDNWTGLVHDFHQHRDRLVVDSVTIVFANPLGCSNETGQEVLLDSMQHQKRYFTSTACGNRLRLHLLNSSVIQLVDNAVLSGTATFLDHLKIFDPDSGEILLFVLVLTPKSLEVYKVHKERLELSISQQLIHEYTSAQVFGVNGAVYCMLAKKTDDRTRPGIFKLSIENGRLHFDLVTSSSLSGESPVQICSVDGQGHLFHYDVDKKQLNTYLFDTLQLEHHQIIEAVGIQSFRCFRIGASHYLAFATFQSMKIFQFVDGFYEALQTLELEGVSTINTLSPPTYRDDTFLLISGFNRTSEEEFVELLLLDASSLSFIPMHATCSNRTGGNRLPHRLKPSDISCLSAMDNLDFSSVTSIILDQHLLLVISDGSVAWLMTVDVHLEPVENPVARQLNGVLEHMETTASAARSASVKSREFLEFSKGVVLHNSDIKLEGSWVVGTVEVPEIPLVNLNQSKVDFNPKMWIPGLDTIVNGIEKNMADLERLLDDIDGRLQGTILNGTEEAVEFGRLVVDGSLLIRQLEVTQLSVEKLNSVAFNPFVNDIVRRDSDRLIENLKVMGTITAKAITAKRVNDIMLEDVLLKSDPNPTITGNLTINGNITVAGDILVGGTVNGVDLSHDLMALNDTYESITFTDVVAATNLSVGHHIDGVNVTQLLPNVFFDQTPDVQLGRVRFDHLIIEGNLEIGSGMINDVDILALNASALRLDTNQLVEGSIVFTQGVQAQSSLTVETINGVKFEDLIVKSTLNDIVMNGEKVFLGDVTAHVLRAESKVNGHYLHSALTLDTNQTVNGDVQLNGIDVTDGDLMVETLNDVEWKAIRENGVHPALLKRPGWNKNVTIRNSCKIDGVLTSAHFKVDGESLEDLLNDIIYANDDHVVITGKKTFPSLKVNSLQVDGYINGMKILDELLTSSTDQTITGHYQFQRYVDFSQLDVRGHLNDYDLDELLGSVLQFDDDLETVSCRLRFDHVSVSDKIIINGSINGFPTELMVLDGIDQTFTAPQRLVSPEFSSLTIRGNLNMTDNLNHVNGLDLDLFDRRRVTVSTDQWIKGTWKLNNLSADALSFRILNGLTVNEWNSSFVHANSRSIQTIEAKGFDVDLLEVRGNMTTALNEVNGYDLYSLSQVAGDIRGNLVFNNVSFDHLETEQMRVRGTVNHYNIQQLKGEVVRHGQKPFVTGTKTFKKLAVKGDVDAELINGRRLIDSFLHINADQTIESPIQFTDQVTAGDLKLVGDSATLNGVPNMLLFSSHTLTHNIHHGDIAFEQPIDVNSLEIASLQGENWQQLVSSLARINETNQFNGTLTFSNPIEVVGALNVAELNNVNIKKFLDDLVLLDVDANITAKKNFIDLKTARLSTRNLSSNSVYPDVMGTARQAIRLDVNDTVNGTIVFATVMVSKNVQTSRLNNQHFPSGFVSLDGDQELSETLEVDKITMLGDILLEDGARVNGLDLKVECTNTWMVDGDEIVESNKVFQGQIEMLGNLRVAQKVNGVPDFSQEVISLATDGIIHGAPHFSDFSVSGDIVNIRLTNDIDLSDLAARTLYLDSPIETDAVWSMNKTFLLGESFLLPIEAKINEQPLNVGQLTGEISFNEPRILKAEERNVYVAALQWHDALRHAYFKMDHLDLNQTIVLPHPVTALSEMYLNGTSILFVGTSGGSMVYRRKSTESSYNLVGIPPDTGNVSKWLTLPPDYAASLSATATKLWHIASPDPFQIDMMEDFGPNVTDITNEDIHGLRSMRDSGNVSTSSPAVLSMAGLQVYERIKTSSELSGLNDLLNSDVKMHHFRLGSKSMIALIMILSPDASASVIGCPGVRLFSTSTGSMKLEHIIPACDVRAITTFSHGNLPDDYLLLAEHDSVTVYHYEGASGYVERFRLPYPTANALHSWSIKSGNDSDLLVAVAKGDRIAIHRSVTVGDYIVD